MKGTCDSVLTRHHKMPEGICCARSWKPQSYIRFGYRAMIGYCLLVGSHMIMLNRYGWPSSHTKLTPWGVQWIHRNW